MLYRVQLYINALKFTIKDCTNIEHIKKAINHPSELKNTWDCLYGTFVDYLYYNDKSVLHSMTVAQLEYRHAVMNPECKENGACIKCGCTVTALQAAKKSCKGNCYPYWMSNKDFIKFMYDNKL